MNIKFSQIATFLGVSLLLSGCLGGGETDEDFHPGTNASAAVLAVEIGSAQNLSGVTELDLGSSDVGVANTRTYTLMNEGRSAANQISLSVTSPFTLESSCSKTLPKEKSCTFTIGLTPTTRGTVSGTLTVSYHNGGEDKSFAIDLNGTGLEASLALSESGTYDYGSVGAYLDSTNDFTLTNSGNRTAESISFSTPSGFSVSSTTCGSSLAASSSCTVSLKFAPTKGQGYSGTLTAAYSATSAQSTSATRAVSGTGLPTWTWMSGAKTAADSAGSYGTKGVAASSNMPPGRTRASSWTDSSGNFWLFGGGSRNDLWKFDGTNWTWISGSSSTGEASTYGTMGVADTANTPGARYGAAAWRDSSNNLWLFGGTQINNISGMLNDLWKFDGTNWTWVAGSNTIHQAGVYGTKGVADPSNYPGARFEAVSYVDSDGNFWLFGGRGYDSNGTQQRLNDLWKFDGTNWTWMSGSNTVNAVASFGTQGVTDPSNVPGARYFSTGQYVGGNFLLFGGEGYDESGDWGALSDLWKWDGTNWTWISGHNAQEQMATYGTKGVAAAANKPSGRKDPSSWVDSSGNFWIFGGLARDSTNTVSYANDLWKWDGTNWTWVSGRSLRNEWGRYGTMGTAGTNNVPGARYYHPVTYLDLSGNLWLFGGMNFDSVGKTGSMNDLWRFAP